VPLDEKDGGLLWHYDYDCPYQVSYAAGPRTTPVVDGDRVYTLGTMGDLLCLDAKKGTKLWSRNLVKDYDASVQTWGFSAHPLVDGDRLICLVGGPGSAAVAFDKMTGKEIWRAVDTSAAGYAPPMIFEHGGKRQLILWETEAVNSLDPETGKVYWSVPFLPGRKGLKAGLSIPTPRLEGDQLFVTAFYNGRGSVARQRPR
jgi:outer membrane protein assembly factor BamB